MHRTAAALSLVAVFLSAPLALQPAAATPSAAPSGTAHCVRNLSTGTEGCFTTFTQAIAAATGGVITDAPADPARATADPVFAQRLTVLSDAIAAGKAAVTASAVLGISWEHINYGGASHTWSASYGCDNSLDVDWQVANVGTTWNDRISSAQSFSNCQSKYWEHANFAGQSTAWFTIASNFGTMNDKATSIQFR